MAEQELRTQLGQLQQHVQQLQEQAQTASALEYRCEGLVKDVQHRDQQIGHLKGEVNLRPPKRLAHSTSGAAQALSLNCSHPCTRRGSGRMVWRRQQPD